MALAANKLLFAGALVFGCTTLSVASDWSVQPTLAWWGDHASNRLLSEGTAPGESVVGSLDLRVARRTETSELLVAPHVLVQRFSNDVSADVDDKRLAVSGRWAFERAELRIGGAIADESTLTTELAETGFVLADASRRTDGGELTWSLYHSPGRQSILSLVHSEVSYTGGYDGRLFGYEYSALSASESFRLSPRTAFNITGAATQLKSAERGSESQERVASVGVEFGWTERTSLAASLGLSRRDVDGSESSGATYDLSIVHKDETRDWSLSLSHALVPYGTGVLAERESAAFALTQYLSPRLQASLNLGIARNRDAGYGFELDRRTYRHADFELGFSMRETWNVFAAAGVAGAEELYSGGDRVDGWRFALRSVWTPAPRSFRTLIP